ncbi:hypothetical protein UMM65_00525 [Aureibaculum sp. 2210JD6-5]|uniref:hypothetical protein n=1 Tax=Aureibaculum sp. 2210JD6-5 TaxID=3103957 RepID=UPI002AACF5E4|nr:hypothetical protein [Aureibaculum sp. 2210JD6-5]MDY7393714.1 hypothetical protein [Aureibaculum sp. 2210JD6-5]
MKTATVTELKRELKHKSSEELLNLCLTLSKFKKENKELLTYLLFEAEDEEAFIQNVKDEVVELFNQINTSSYFYIKKSVRKILRMIKKYIRYSKKKETQVELLLFFCEQLKEMHPPMQRNTSLLNIFDRQILTIKKVIGTLHEDLQYDYTMELEEILEK